VQSVEHLCSILPDLNSQRARAVPQRQLGFLLIKIVWFIFVYGYSLRTSLWFWMAFSVLISQLLNVRKLTLSFIDECFCRANAFVVCLMHSLHRFDGKLMIVFSWYSQHVAGCFPKCSNFILIIRIYIACDGVIYLHLLLMLRDNRTAVRHVTTITMVTCCW